MHVRFLAPLVRVLRFRVRRRPFTPRTAFPVIEDAQPVGDAPQLSDLSGDRGGPTDVAPERATLRQPHHQVGDIPRGHRAPVEEFPQVDPVCSPQRRTQRCPMVGKSDAEDDQFGLI